MIFGTKIGAATMYYLQHRLYKGWPNSNVWKDKRIFNDLNDAVQFYNRMNELFNVHRPHIEYRIVQKLGQKQNFYSNYDVY